MKLSKQILLVAAVLATRIPAMAQVEKVAMRTTGISCGVCAAVSEVHLRRLPAVYKIAISLSKEAVMISYKPGAAFQPADLREALKKSDVGVAQFQISARGRVQEQAGKQYFIAGKDKFVIVSSPPGSLPAGGDIAVEAIVDDKPAPMELKILSAKALK